MQDGKFLTLDAEKIRKQANEIGARISRALQKK
jgi:hypothetical protein